MSTLANISSGFARELLELTEALARGENVEHRLRVLREWAKTWMDVAEGMGVVVRR